MGYLFDIFRAYATIAKDNVKDKLETFKDTVIYPVDEGIDLKVLAEEVAQKIEIFLQSEKNIENVQYFETNEGFAVQAKDSMFGVKGFLGTSQAIQIHLIIGDNAITAKIGKGEWYKNIGGRTLNAAAKLVVFAPLAITNVAGYFKQIKLLSDTHEYIWVVINEYENAQMKDGVQDGEYSDDAEATAAPIKLSHNIGTAGLFSKFISEENIPAITDEDAPTNTFSVADEITKFKGLLDVGILTQDEFDKKKAQLLNF
jgi:hypothetical protein